MGRNGREYDKENTIGQQYMHNHACVHRDKLFGEGIGSRLAFAVVDGFHRHGGVSVPTWPFFWCFMWCNE